MYSFTVVPVIPFSSSSFEPFLLSSFHTIPEILYTSPDVFPPELFPLLFPPLSVLFGFLFIIFVISLVIIGPFVYIFSILAYKPEHVVYKNDEKYVAYVIAFHMTEVKYYEYKNIFVSGSKVKIIEYYGKGGFDPLDSKNGYVHNVESVDYYE